MTTTPVKGDNSPDHMRAVIHHRYGAAEHLKLDQVPKPQPSRGEVLVRIHATTVTPSDIMIRSGRFPLLFLVPVRLMMGVFRPRNLILGYEFAGVVERIGADVEKFSQGDRVFGASYWKMSAHAEYICMEEDAAIQLQPSNLSHEEVAGLPDGASTALHFLQMGGIQSREKVLIYGASGSVGTFAVQLAKYFGAEVTAVCSTPNFNLVMSLGADHTIDYHKEDYGQRKGVYDLIFDAVGRSSFKQAKPALVDGGIFLTTKFSLGTKLRDIHTRFGSNKRLKTALATSNHEKLRFLRELVENKNIHPVIDKTFSLEEIVAAHQYVETGHKKGNVIVVVR